jgi:xanthine dehydrogenase accessory factor
MELYDLLLEQAEALKKGQDFAVVTIAEAEGLARTGGKMVVYPDGSFHGTVGGGMWEQCALRDARRCLEERVNAVRVYDFSNELERAGIRCQGKLTVFIEYCSAARTQLVVVGGGHVGGAVLRAARTVGFATTLLDTRGEAEIGNSIQAADRFLALESFGDVRSAELPKGAYYVISTYGHQVDAAALGGVLARGDAAYIGMLGSKKKVAAIFSQLLQAGTEPALLEQVCAPIGLDLGGETPEEVALSIVSQLLMVKYKRSGRPLRELRADAQDKG